MYLKPYLIFTGNCREALETYARCLGGEIVMLQTYADSPLDVPDELSDKVFNSELRAGDVRFMASDTAPPFEIQVGTNFSMFLAIADPKEQERIYTELSEGGEVVMPLAGGFGMVQDRFGVRWMLAQDASA